MKNLILKFYKSLWLLMVLKEVMTQGFSQIIPENARCPIGFNYLESTDLCYQVKRNERFTQKYDRCSGNEVPLNFRKDYKDAFNNYSINLFWTDYVRMYDGGPFVNWRLEDSEMGKPVNVTIQNKSKHHGCSFIEISSGEIKSAYCNASYARLCVVKPYEKAYPYYWECPQGYIPYAAPVPTCLIAKTTNQPRRVNLRVTWNQSNTICHNDNTYLPQRGYMYLNHQEFLHLGNQDIPLGIKIENATAFWVTPYDGNDNRISIYEHLFQNSNYPQLSYGHVALSSKKWFEKPNGFIYYNIVCEKFITLPKVDIHFTGKRNQQIFLSTSEDIASGDLWCFTDAFTYYPIKIGVYKLRKDSMRSYFLETFGNGYYWCALVNTRQYIPHESRKYLFIKNVEELRNVFAIKIEFYKDIGFSDYIIKEYLQSFFSDYNLVFGSNESEVLFKLKYENGSLPDHISKHRPLLINISVKAIYSLERSVLIHASFFNEFVRSYRLFKYFNFVYVRNVKYCPAKGILNETTIGEKIDIVTMCKRYICSGDFNEGAYWTVTELEDCIPQTTIMLPDDTTITTTTEMSTTAELETSSIITTPQYLDTTTITTTIPHTNPDEQINNVLDVLDNILSGPVNTSQLQEAVHMISNLFENVDNVAFPSAILQNIDAMLSKVDLPKGKKDFMIVKPSMAVAVADKSRNSSVVGIKLKAVEDDALDENSFQFLSHDDYIDDSEVNDIMVKLPRHVIQGASGRISFTIFKDDKPFSQNSTRVNSKVLSIAVNGMNIFQNSKYIDMHFRSLSSITSNETKVCAYWKFLSKGGGKWATDGCTFLPANGPGGLDTCRCTHLTHFAQLITGANHFGRDNYNVLTIISLVGCVLSLIGLIIIALTGIMFRSWRNDFSNKIWLHLSGAMTILIFTFLLVTFSEVKGEKNVYCMITGILLHYSVLASFGWMFMSAVLSYQRLVTVFTKSSSHKLLKACICGWILPFIPIGILFVIDRNSYSQYFVVDNVTKHDICYPSGYGLWFAVFLPIALIIVVNAVLFSLIVYSVFINSKIKRHGDNKQLFRSITVSFLLFFLFGLTWVFGLFSHNVIMAYLFCITATHQGLVLCLFFVVGNKKTRDLWLVQLKLKEKKKIPTTTSMSRSYPSRGNSKSGKTMSIKKSDDDLPTKPRSLSVRNDKSDSRFS